MKHDNKGKVRLSKEDVVVTVGLLITPRRKLARMNMNEFTDHICALAGNPPPLRRPTYPLLVRKTRKRRRKNTKRL